MATNNNLIPININDLPKLDILTNSDLIPIETVEGTATILYRDFIIDEAHVTFAATLSASVTSAINLSAAIDTTNATVKTVSASLYSSITALSSYSIAYSNALSSRIVSLNATVTALSANVNTLSSAVAVNTTNIASISANTTSLSSLVTSITSQGISSSGNIIGANTSSFWLPPAGNQITGTAYNKFFANSDTLYLSANSTYIARFQLFYSKDTASGTVTFALSTLNVPVYVSGQLIHCPVAGLDSIATTSFNLGVLNTTALAVTEFPATGSLTFANNFVANIVVTIVTNTSTTAFLMVKQSAGNLTPLRGGFRELVKVS